MTTVTHQVPFFGKYSMVIPPTTDRLVRSVDDLKARQSSINDEIADFYDVPDVPGANPNRCTWCGKAMVDDMEMGMGRHWQCGESFQDVPTCRVCSCTDDTACLDADGETCSWAEADLCSACVEVHS